MIKNFVFDDSTVTQIFGQEDAEYEEPAKLKECFFKNKAYENMSQDLPIRVLIGHKGVGKSAVLKWRFTSSATKVSLHYGLGRMTYKDYLKPKGLSPF